MCVCVCVFTRRKSARYYFSVKERGQIFTWMEADESAERKRETDGNALRHEVELRNIVDDDI